MVRPEAQHLLIGVLLAAMLVPCACDARPSSPDPTKAGAAGPPPRPWDMRIGYEPRAMLTLPLSTQARWEQPDEAKFLVNLIRSGDIRVMGDCWPLRYATADERREALDDLRSVWEQRCGAEGAMLSDGDCPLPILLHADRWANWQNVRDVLLCLLKEPIQPRRLLLAVESRATDVDVVLEAVLSPLAADDDRSGRAGLSIDLRGKVLDDESVEVHFAVSEEGWTSTYEKHADDEEQERALRALEAAREHIASAARGHEHATIGLPEQPQAVRWGHVASVLDMLLGAGLREVDIPQLGARLSFAEPEELVPDPFRDADDPVLTPLALVLCALGLVLAFGVTFAPLVWHRGARRRARPA